MKIEIAKTDLEKAFEITAEACAKETLRAIDLSGDYDVGRAENMNDLVRSIHKRLDVLERLALERIQEKDADHG